MAVLPAVPEFAHALLKDLGAPKGRIRTFTEVNLKDDSGKGSIPDGAIVVDRGRTRWGAFVEVKTGDAELSDDQVGRYLEHAKSQGLGGVLTISNRITSSVDESPVTVDRRRARGVDLWHLSWWRILTEAVVQHRFRGVSDPDQAWILGELIAYLDHERSGAGGFTDMGDRWVSVREGAHNGTLRQADPEARAVVERWEQFGDYLALGLAQDLGRDVALVRPRRLEPSARLAAQVKALADAGHLAMTIRVPDAAAPMDVRADLRARRVFTSVVIDAPKEMRALARINWMLRQLREAPGDLRIEVAFAGAQETTSLLLRDALEEPKRLLSPTDPKRSPRSFALEMSRPLGSKRGKARGSFVAETRDQAVGFYRDLIQQLTAWRPRAPRLPSDGPAATDAADPASAEPPPFAGGGRDPGEAREPATA